MDIYDVIATYVLDSRLGHLSSSHAYLNSNVKQLWVILAGNLDIF